MQCGSVGACMYRSSSRLLTPLPPSSVRLRSPAFPLPLFLTAVVRGREGGREGGGMAHASTSAAAAAYAPSIINVNSQDGSLSHWLRHRRRAAARLSSRGGREARKLLAPVAVVPRNGDSRIDREREREKVPRSLPLFLLLLLLLLLLLSPLPPLARSLRHPPPPSSERSLSC